MRQNLVQNKKVLIYSKKFEQKGTKERYIFFGGGGG